MITLSVAGKTFLAGEYLALYGGPALIAATKPRFELEVKAADSATMSPFHIDSPAGKLWLKHANVFSRFHLNFTDPYQTGGFGASTAQFVLLHSLWQLRDQVFTETERFFDWHQMISDYRELAHQGTGFPPSGADLVGMCRGGLTYFERNTGSLQSFAWPFQEMDFILAKTSEKIATHEHLASLEKFETESLEEAMKTLRQGLAELNWDLFMDGLKHFRKEIEIRGWTIPSTKNLVRALEKHPEILFAKGCGAMGADVVLVLFEKKNSVIAKNIVTDAGLHIRATSADLSAGIEIQYPAKNVEVSL